MKVGKPITQKRINFAKKPVKLTTEDFCPNIADGSINKHMEKYKDIICTVPRCDKSVEGIACSTTFITHLDVKTKIKYIKKVNDTH